MSTEVEQPPPAQAEAQPAEAPPQPQGPLYSERVNALSESAKAHWQLTGDLDAAEAIQGGPKAKSDAKAESSPAEEPAAPPGETEGESGPPKQEPQPKEQSNRQWRQ